MSRSALDGYNFCPLKAESVQAASELEALSFPPDEAASLEAITQRQEKAGAYFYGLYRGDQELVGFVNGTCTRGSELHHETMSRHDAAGRTLCIHSVVVHPTLRRQGLATGMLKAYVTSVFRTTEVDLILLLSKANLIGLYQGCGFEFVRVSPVTHGKDVWFELRVDRISVLRKRVVLQVDAFATKPLGGNPAAVVFAEPDDTAEWMQAWGAEINLSETAFLVPLPDEQPCGDEAEATRPSRFSLRWFTPTTEVDLCGHATLASAHALWESRRVDKARLIAFETKSGVLTAARGEGGWITLDFPAVPPSPIAKDSGEFDTVLEAFGCRPEQVLYIGRNVFDVFVVLEASAFRQPDVGVLGRIECRGVIATRKGLAGEEEYDFVSRCFFPRCGIPEDPVTGSAHCCLGPYWAEQLGKAELLAYQASHRGGVLRVVVTDNGRVKLSGQAALVKEGYLCC